MKKEIIAIIILILLFSATLLNTLFLTRSIDSLVRAVNSSESAVASGDLNKAVSELEHASSKWKAMDFYTNIFVRDGEIDSVTDAFYELFSYLYSGDTDSAKGAYGKLREHLASISDVEQITLSNIF